MPADDAKQDDAGNATEPLTPHTPGPWVLGFLGDIVYAGPLAVDTATLTYGQRAIVANLDADRIDWDGDDSERWANGRLIAAAPDLLHACRELPVLGRPRAMRGLRRARGHR